VLCAMCCVMCDVCVCVCVCMCVCVCVCVCIYVCACVCVGMCIGIQSISHHLESQCPSLHGNILHTSAHSVSLSPIHHTIPRVEHVELLSAVCMFVACDCRYDV